LFYKISINSYYIRRFNRQIYKALYPFQFKLSGQENNCYELIDIVRPNNNYIIFESLDQVKENNNNKYIHIISLVNHNDIIINRGIYTDIKINDIFVFRSYMKLNFDFENIKEKKSLNIQIWIIFIKVGVTGN